MLRDQRTMTGPRDLTTVDEVVAYWNHSGATHGFPRTRRKMEGRELDIRAEDFQLRSSSDTLVAMVSGGRWVADCPLCGGGVALWVDNPQACCLTCGTVYSSVDWPSKKQMTEVDNVLSERPEEQRTWRRDIGQTIKQLRVENAGRTVEV